MNKKTYTLPKKRGAQSNQLLLGSFESTAIQRDLFYILLSKMTDKDVAGTQYQFEAQEVKELRGSASNSLSSRRIYDELLKFSKIDIRITHNSVKGERDEEIINILESVRMQEEGKRRVKITAEVTSKARKHLLELADHFTTLSLEVLLNLNGAYTKRLYEILSRFKYKFDKGEPVYFRKSQLLGYFGLQNKKSYVNNSAEFKRSVLDKAIKELNENELTSSLKFKFETVSSGHHAGFNETGFMFSQGVEEKQVSEEQKMGKIASEKSSVYFNEITSRMSENSFYLTRMAKLDLSPAWMKVLNYSLKLFREDLKLHKVKVTNPSAVDAIFIQEFLDTFYEGDLDLELVTEGYTINAKVSSKLNIKNYKPKKAVVEESTPRDVWLNYLKVNYKIILDIMGETKALELVQKSLYNNEGKSAKVREELEKLKVTLSSFQ
ncbi:replication initiation protein [Flammeovirga agarivorans]|uniref:Replication initiation protein n=1 Tax=Flammeovirga agarivorans TaxID=2726742 RepID=A0A7X8XZ94_9BACT|nr:replication initiation protein [Flammeovirga agarivorans]NLR94954.1 replication initiation protein [Flammeovirga agarivorans]